MPELHQLCDRVTKVEETIDLHAKRLSDLHDANMLHTSALSENTRMTKESVEVAKASIEIAKASLEKADRTANNTDELVDLFKGAKSFRRFALWVVSLGIGIGAPIWGFIEFVRHFK